MATHITTPTELQNMNMDLTADYILDNDLDMTAFSWTPIGTGGVGFSGSFNGQNFTISNLIYDDTIPNNQVAGIFGFITGGTYQNVILNNFILTGNNSIGALCGFVSTTNGSNPRSTVNISNIIIKNITINGIGSQPTDFGSLCGFITVNHSYQVVIQNCNVPGLIINCSGGENSIGGFIGQTIIDSDVLDISIMNCYAKNIIFNGIDNSGINEIGGFIGAFQGTLEKCYSSGTITNINNNCGGFIGFSDIFSITDCYSHTTITGDTGSSNTIGGFIGFFKNEGSGNQSDLTNCYSSGTVTGDTNSSVLGSFIGYLWAPNLGGVVNITNCYSVGVVSPLVGDNTIATNGGFLGGIRTDFNATVTISNCAWYTGAFDFAIGFIADDFASTIVYNKSLTDEGYGTDEPVNTTLYFKTHAVYAQGGTDPWDFIN